MMNEDKHTPPPEDERLPEAVVQNRSRISLVWLIPIVAAAIGAWLAYKAYSEQGPEITITFKTAEGLEAGKTKLKYKEVEFGQVERVELNQDLSRVIVTARLEKGAEKFLTDKTRFWVERARVSAGGVRGLGTLLGGAYIGVDPVATGKRTNNFKGLEVPPVVTSGEDGSHFMLHAEDLGSVEVGAPVYFRQIRVGEVVSYVLDSTGNSVDIQIFVTAPHDQRVHENTRFWNASGVDFSLGADGLRVNTGSLTSILIGGIAFENPPQYDQGALAEEDAVFRLYSSRMEAIAEPPEYLFRYLLYFTGSVRGLEPGAPVEFRGIKLGEVADVKMQLNVDDFSIRIPVIIELSAEGKIDMLGDTSFYGSKETLDETRRTFWNTLVERGLRAQLKMGSLVTGALFVDLDFYPDEEPQTVDWDGGKYPELPTIPTPMEELQGVLMEVVNKFKALPLDKMSAEAQQILAALSKTAVQFEQLMGSLNTSIAPALGSALTQAQRTLRSAENTVSTAEKTIAPNSSLQRELQALLRELGSAARSVRVMADYLERHPEALIKGKTGRGR